MQHENPQHARDRRRHGIGPDQQRAIDAGAADRLVGHDRQQQGKRKRRSGDGRGEHEGSDDGVEVFRLAQQVGVILEPDERGRKAERILQQKRLPYRLQRRPIEEDQNDRDLRDQQQEGQQREMEDGLLLHARCQSAPARIVMAGPVPAIHVLNIAQFEKTWMPGTRPGMTAFGRVRHATSEVGMTRRSCYFDTVRSNWRSIALPRCTAESSASLADFLPANAPSISSAQMSRNWTMLPSRSPREFAVGSLLVSSSSGVSR